MCRSIRNAPIVFTDHLSLSSQYRSITDLIKWVNIIFIIINYSCQSIKIFNLINPIMRCSTK